MGATGPRRRAPMGLRQPGPLWSRAVMCKAALAALTTEPPAPRSLSYSSIYVRTACVLCGAVLRHPHNQKLPWKYPQSDFFLLAHLAVRLMADLVM